MHTFVIVNKKIPNSRAEAPPPPPPPPPKALGCFFYLIVRVLDQGNVRITLEGSQAIAWHYPEGSQGNFPHYSAGLLFPPFWTRKCRRFKTEGIIQFSPLLGLVFSSVSPCNRNCYNSKTGYCYSSITFDGNVHGSHFGLVFFVEFP